MSIKWSFIPNHNGEIKGINDSGVATFRGTPLKSLAREICQNSMDASANSDHVVVEFNCFELSVDNIPGVNELKDAFERSREYWGAQKTSQTKDFFESAIKEFEKNTISVLRISDFNTKGLCGSRQSKETDWTNLIKSSGVSDKHGTAGGSYGIGKYATFACSKFSTVFYSTYDINNEMAYQGVSRIVTFTRQDGEDTTGLGFYGEEKNKPVLEQLILDNSFVRKLEQYGTDIYIMAFSQAQSDWKREIVISILDSFLIAVWKGQLKVLVDDIEISKNSLPELMEEYKQSFGSSYAYSYYKVLTSKETQWIEEENFYGLGKIKFGILFLNEASRRVAMVRKTGMRIKDQGNISSYIPFMGVMMIEGDTINERLRLIENPQHTEWEPQRSPDEIRNRELISALNKFMKEYVERIAFKEKPSEEEAFGLGELIPEVTEHDSDKNIEENVNNNTNNIESKIIIQKAKNLKIKKKQQKKESGSTIERKKEDVDAKGADSNNSHHKHNHVENDKNHTTKKQREKEIDIVKFIFVSQDISKGKYILKIIPERNAENGVIELAISGEVSSFPAKIKSAFLFNGQSLRVDGNYISGMQFVKNQQLLIKIELDIKDYCALEVNAYEN